MKRNDEIQNEADKKLELKLMKLFEENELEYKQHESDQKKEKGIDFYCHVYNRKDQSQILFFETQNKGTNKPVKLITSLSHLEKGKISFQLELRHVKQYYNELTEALIFMYTDITTDISYWYSIQLDTSIPEKIKQKEIEIKKSNKKSKPTIQIYIPSENIINQENFEAFVKEIKLSREQQNYKHNSIFKVKTNYNFIKNKVEGKHIIDKVIYTIDLFEGINVIPTNIISQLYPFKGTQQKTYIYESSLKTDNEEFYDLMNNIQIVNEKFVLNGDKCDDEISPKLEKIARFFRVNCIEHINWNGENKKENLRICVHKLLVVKRCDCERCNYDRLNFIEAKKLLNNHSDEYNLHEKLRRGYTSYSLGDFTDAVKKFKEVDLEATTNKKSIFSTIAKYNLIQLRKIITNTYSEKNRSGLLELLKDENLELKEADIKLNAPHFYDLYTLIKDDNFFERAFSSIDNKLDEIKKISFNDKYGVLHSNNHYENLLISFLRLYYFLEFNLIIYNSFYEYKQLSTKVLEGICALYTIKNPNASRYKKFTSTILNMWIFDVEYDSAIHLLNKYNIKTIRVENKNEIFSKFYSYIENLNNSVEIVLDENNLILHEKTELIIRSLTLIISRIKFSESQINDLFGQLILVLKKLNERSMIPFGALYQLLSHHKKINNKNIQDLIFLLIEHKAEGTSTFSYSIKHYAENSNPHEIETLIFKIINADNFSEESLFAENNKFESLGYAVSFLDNNTRGTIKNIITHKLKNNFEPGFFHLSAIYDLIDYDKDLLNEFIKCIPDQTKKDPAIRRFFNQNENYRLGQLINLIYKYDLPFSDEMKSLSNFTFQKDYYDWLMDLDGFDYSKLNHYWILEYETKYYYKAFRNSKKLKSEIGKALKKEYIEGVAIAYFKIYT